MEDSTHSIARSAKRFFSGTMLSRVTGLLRDVAMAFVFGTQEATAGFLVAFRFSHLLRRLLGEGAMQTAFIPHYEKLRKEDPQKAAFFFRDLAAGLTLLLVFLIALIMGTLGLTLHFFNLTEGNREIITLTLIMMPSLLFICLYGLNAALLQCDKSFFTSSAAPCAFNLVWIVGLFCLWNFSAEQAMPWLSGFIILACASQWFMTVPQTVKILSFLKVTWKNVNFFSKELRQLLKPLFLGIIGISAAQINNALDPLFARYADSEGPAFLWYAIRLQQLPLALFGVALSGALLPPLSRAVKSQDEVKYRHFLNYAFRKTIAFTLPITVGLFLMGDSCVQLIYGRGSFQTESIVGTTECLWGYGFGLIPMALILILGPSFYALDDYRTPTIGALAAVGLNVILNAWLIMGMHFGAASVAWATSLSAWANVVYLMLHVKKFTISTDFFFNSGKVLLATVAGSVALLCVGSHFLPIAQSQIPFYSTSFLESLLHFALQFGSFTFLFFCVAWLLKADDLFFIFRLRQELKRS